jgi:hypothetical protein
MDTPRSFARGLLTRYRYLLVIALALLCIGGVALYAATSQTGAGAGPVSAPTVTSSTTPGLTWNQPSLSPSVVAGAAAATATISFTATGKLPNAVVQLSSNLAGFVSVSPKNLGTVIQGQTVTLTLTASAPSSSTPTVVQGSVQVQKQQNPPLEVYGNPLPLTLNIAWPSVSNPLVTISFPPALAAQAQLASPIASTEADGGTYIEVPISVAGGPPITIAIVAVYPNSASQTLTQWFEQNIDTNGELLQGGSYTAQSFPDGKTALVKASPFPVTYDGPPVTGYAYVLSPKGKYLASVTLGQDKTYLYQLGYNTQDELNALLQNVTAALTFNE